ncbi:MAG: aspartate/glutamate racemase family protein [Ruminococcus flavefaciens]|nr:aspartate/glutamate racemase family protein [Ruminococcus flavefaciens]
MKKPVIAVLRWESGHVPAGLLQLEQMPGNSTNPASYPFPVKLVEVKGANVETVIIHPSQTLLADMIALSKDLIEQEDIRAITTSCGFNAIFQEALSAALPVPVFTSALLQIPFVQQIIGKDRTVAVITANKKALSEQHLRACGITEQMNVQVFGLDEAKEWNKIFDQPDQPFDMEAVSKEIEATAIAAVRSNPKIGAIVLECTDLPPYAARIRQAVNLPVFDFSSMMGFMSIALGAFSLY